MPSVHSLRSSLLLSALKVGFIPVYMTRAQAAAREMKALRSRLDRSLARAQALSHCAQTGKPLVPTDLGAYAEAAAGLSGSLSGWNPLGSWSASTSAASAPAHQATTQPEQMEPVDGGGI